MIETNIIRVRYWAAARAAAGVAGDDLPVNGPITPRRVVRRRAVALHPGTRLAEVLAGLLDPGRRPAGRHRGPGDVLVEPGPSVEFLPPFAGG